MWEVLATVLCLPCDEAWTTLHCKTACISKKACASFHPSFTVGSCCVKWEELAGGWELECDQNWGEKWGWKSVGKMMLNVRCSPFYEICLVDVNSALCFPRSLFQSSAAPESDALRLILFCCPVDGSTFSSDYTHWFWIYCPFSVTVQCQNSTTCYWTNKEQKKICFKVC